MTESNKKTEEVKKAGAAVIDALEGISSEHEPLTLIAAVAAVAAGAAGRHIADFDMTHEEVMKAGESLSMAFMNTYTSAYISAKESQEEPVDELG